MSAQDPSLDDRYGQRSLARRRRIVVAAVAALAVVFCGWVAWVAWFHSTPPVHSELQRFEVSSDHETQAQVRVWLDREALDGDEATCVVRAMAYDHAVVGELAFSPTDGSNDVTIRTERRAYAVESVGCTAPGHDRPR